MGLAEPFGWFLPRGSPFSGRVHPPIGKMATVGGERDLQKPPGLGGGGRSGWRGEEPTTEPGSLLRKHAKNAVGSRPVGQDHKEAFVLGGVQGADGQNSRGGGSTLLGEHKGISPYTVPTVPLLVPRYTHIRPNLGHP